MQRLEPKVATNPEDLMTQIFDALDTVGWLGEGSFLPSRRHKAPHRAIEDLSYVRRVLIGWLGGRPVSEIAARVGCSDRLIYSVLRGAIYEVEYDRFEYWAELGLVGIIDLPLLMFTEPSWDEFQEEYEYEFDPTSPIVICQVCHQIIGNVHIETEDRTYRGNYIGFHLQEWDQLGGADDRETFAHLFGHFALREEPIGAPGVLHRELLDTEKDLRVRELIHSDLAMQKRKHFARSSWEDNVDEQDWALIDKWENAGNELLNPIMGGRRLTTDESQQHWRRVLKVKDPS